MIRLACFFGVAALACGPAHHLSAAEPPLVEKYLHSGGLAAGEEALLAELKEHPRNDQARFGLGALQFIGSIERLGQQLHRYGLRSDRGPRMNVPFLRLPVPVNANPESFRYKDARQILKDLLDGLATAERTLAGVADEEVKLPLRLGSVMLDLVGDGKANERFADWLHRYFRVSSSGAQNGELLVVFDRGDVAWLRGYCHLLMALAEVGLAHDGSDLFDRTAHIFFARPETPHTFLTEPNRRRTLYDLGDGVDLIDIIAFVHLVRLPVEQPARMTSALGHLQQMVVLSRESWKYVLAEADDDHEWIPNPAQTGVLGFPVGHDMVDTWRQFLDEADELLSGKRLVPFWRGKEDRGVNLHRVFTEPRTLDLVLWIQGTAATPYLEPGPLTKPGVWTRLQQVFGGQFIGFAIWFN